MPSGKQERSQSLDMTGKNHLAGARRKIFGNKLSTSQSNVSPSSSCMSSESELNSLGFEGRKKRTRKSTSKSKGWCCDVV